MSGRQIVDPVALERLQRLGGTAFVSQMIGLFIDYAGSKIAEARKASASGNTQAVEKAVHPVKSSAGNVGATRVQGLAQEIETLAQTDPQVPLDILIGELEQAFQDAKCELEARRKNLAS